LETPVTPILLVTATAVARPYSTIAFERTSHPWVPFDHQIIRVDATPAEVAAKITQHPLMIAGTAVEQGVPANAYRIPAGARSCWEARADYQSGQDRYYSENDYDAGETFRLAHADVFTRHGTTWNCSIVESVPRTTEESVYVVFDTPNRPVADASGTTWPFRSRVWVNAWRAAGETTTQVYIVGAPVSGEVVAGPGAQIQQGNWQEVTGKVEAVVVEELQAFLRNEVAPRCAPQPLSDPYPGRSLPREVRLPDGGRVHIDSDGRIVWRDAAPHSIMTAVAQATENQLLFARPEILLVDPSDGSLYAVGFAQTDTGLTRTEVGQGPLRVAWAARVEESGAVEVALAGNRLDRLWLDDATVTNGRVLAVFGGSHARGQVIASYPADPTRGFVVVELPPGARGRAIATDGDTVLVAGGQLGVATTWTVDIGSWQAWWADVTEGPGEYVELRPSATGYDAIRFRDGSFDRVPLDSRGRCAAP
jgi:hypothetical protein